MFKLLKYLFWLLVVLLIVFAYWFVPKYSFIRKNPGYCVSLSHNLYYCGDAAGLEQMMGATK